LAGVEGIKLKAGFMETIILKHKRYVFGPHETKTGTVQALAWITDPYNKSSLILTRFDLTKTLY